MGRRVLKIIVLSGAVSVTSTFLFQLLFAFVGGGLSAAGLFYCFSGWDEGYRCGTSVAWIPGVLVGIIYAVRSWRGPRGPRSPVRS